MDTEVENHIYVYPSNLLYFEPQQNIALEKKLLKNVFSSVIIYISDVHGYLLYQLLSRINGCYLCPVSVCYCVSVGRAGLGKQRPPNWSFAT